MPASLPIVHPHDPYFFDPLVPENRYTLHPPCILQQPVAADAEQNGPSAAAAAAGPGRLHMSRYPTGQASFFFLCRLNLCRPSFVSIVRKGHPGAALPPTRQDARAAPPRCPFLPAGKAGTSQQTPGGTCPPTVKTALTGGTHHFMICYPA